jgi:hypothetical protein
MKDYPRREFLLRALVACGTPFVASIASLEGARKPQSRADDDRETQGAQTAGGYFGGNTDAARAIGEAYMRQLGLDNSAESIRGAARGALGSIRRSSTQQNAISALILAVQRDFHDGRSVQVQGWILSRTEAELCALTLLPTTK